MDDREGWQERIREFYVSSTNWWWWWQTFKDFSWILIQFILSKLYIRKSQTPKKEKYGKNKTLFSKSVPSSRKLLLDIKKPIGNMRHQRFLLQLISIFNFDINLKKIVLVSVSLFNVISTFIHYLMPNLSK